MPHTRREFLSASAAFAAGFAGLHVACGPRPARAAGQAVGIAPFGPLKSDPEGLLDLPEGFSYRIISRVGEEMSDGLVLPGLPDGMAAFPGPDGLTIVMRNHELHDEAENAFGDADALLSKVDTAKLYDTGKTKPIGGGVSTLVYDTREQRVVRQFLSLGGTSRNCAGGPTPWGSWITCEESNETPTHGEHPTHRCLESHGFPFEVAAQAEGGLQKAEPLRAMGRFRREAVAVDPKSGIVYQTEDIDDGSFYRFIPNEPGKLAAGGKLQALAIKGKPGIDTRNWSEPTIQAGERVAVEWIDLDNPEAPEDDLRKRSQAAGAACFARGEGIWWTDGGAYFACTSGGREKIGQLWRFMPGASGDDSLELFIEPNDSNLIENADNLTAAPWGDLVVCEDRQGDVVRLVGVTGAGELYTLAHSHARSEFAGVTFTPDGSTLLVNMQYLGITVAITGPWPQSVG